MRMKNIIYLFVALSVVFELCGCESNMVLEYKNIAHFKITEYKDGENSALQIIGLCMHSNYVVKKSFFASA